MSDKKCGRVVIPTLLLFSTQVCHDHNFRSCEINGNAQNCAQEVCSFSFLTTSQIPWIQTLKPIIKIDLKEIQWKVATTIILDNEAQLEI